MKLKRLSYCTFIIFAFISCKSEGQSKHLFILSGQSNMVGLDPQISFIPTVEAALGKENVIVVKDAKGSQPISRWYEDWKSPEGAVPEITGDLYDILLQKVKGSIKDTKIASVTFIWMQGERDARMKYGEVYEKSLLGLYEQLSLDLHRKDINFIIGRLSDFDMQNEKWPHWTMVRDIQMKVGKSTPRFGWINTDDLNDGKDKNGKDIINDLHMAEKGYRIMGERFAEKAIQLIREND